jgi:hypothetical protein
MNELKRWRLTHRHGAAVASFWARTEAEAIEKAESVFPPEQIKWLGEIGKENEPSIYVRGSQERT